MYSNYTAVSATAISLVSWMVGAWGGWCMGDYFSVLTPRNPSKNGRQTANSRVSAGDLTIAHCWL